jgi:hypothetical protein
LTALDILVLIAVFGAAIQGFLRGSVTEVLALFAWVAMVAALKLFHIPLAQTLTGVVGTVSGAAVLAFALIVGVTYLGGRLVARAIGQRTRAGAGAGRPGVGLRLRRAQGADPGEPRLPGRRADGRYGQRRPRPATRLDGQEPDL